MFMEKQAYYPRICGILGENYILMRTFSKKLSQDAWYTAPGSREVHLTPPCYPALSMTNTPSMSLHGLPALAHPGRRIYRPRNPNPDAH